MFARKHTQSMPKTRTYIDKMTRRDEGREVQDPEGEAWIVRGVAQKTRRGRRRWYVGLQHAEDRGRYQELEMDRIVNRNWQWAEEPKRAAGPTSTTREVPRDEEGRRLCRRCGDPIFFIEMQRSGKAMPVDHEGIGARDVVEEMDDPSFDKPTGFVTRAGKVLSMAELKDAAKADMTVYRSHFVTCTGT